MNQILYLKKHSSMYQDSFLIYISSNNVWSSLAYISVSYSEVINLTGFNFTLQIYPYGFLILMIKTIIQPQCAIHYLDLTTQNMRALSLYYWCGYQIIRQRARLYQKKDGLNLRNKINRTANIQRRLLILR